LNAPFDIEELNSLADLERTRSSWIDLWARCPDATPFQRPEWLIPWWQHLGAGQLRTVAFWSDEELVGLVPLYVSTQANDGSSSMLFVGTGNSDYLDAICVPEKRSAIATGLIEHLAALSNEWDVCEFRQLPATSLLLEAQPEERWVTDLLPDEVCPVIQLPGAGAGIETILSANMVANLEYYRRRARKNGAIQIIRGDESNCERLMAELIRMQSLRWNAAGGGVLEPKAIQAFHYEVVKEMAGTGILRLHALTIAEEIIAIFYGFSCKGRTYYYLGGFDPDRANISPGTLMIGEMVESAVQEGSRVFDFLRGQEEYKYRWGAVDQPTWRRRFAQVKA
jgi:CelD/BcsL family acetyltransferase involved in cellulose biosynthesis